MYRKNWNTIVLRADSNKNTSSFLGSEKFNETTSGARRWCYLPSSRRVTRRCVVKDLNMLITSTSMYSTEKTFLFFYLSLRSVRQWITRTFLRNISSVLYISEWAKNKWLQNLSSESSRLERVKNSYDFEANTNVCEMQNYPVQRKTHVHACNRPFWLA